MMRIIIILLCKRKKREAKISCHYVLLQETSTEIENSYQHCSHQKQHHYRSMKACGNKIQTTFSTMVQYWKNNCFNADFSLPAAVNSFLLFFFFCLKNERRIKQTTPPHRFFPHTNAEWTQHGGIGECIAASAQHGDELQHGYSMEINYSMDAASR